MRFKEVKDRIVVLGRAEYRYDRLVSDFAEHYTEMVQAGYKHLPDIEAFRVWLRHLVLDIRPGLINAWRDMARYFGFELGDKISANGTDIYVVRMTCYPLEEVVRFTGFGVKKDGKPSQTSVTVTVSEHSKIQRHDKRLDPAIIEPLFFEGTTRLATVKSFLIAETAEVLESVSNKDGSNFTV